MARKLLRTLGILFVGASIIATSFASAPGTQAAGSTQTAALPAQTNSEGRVSVTVTPLDVSPTAESWRFDVQLNTHVTPLDQDLMQIAVLIDSAGNELKPTAWQGDPPGGHHRHGVLIFAPIQPAPLSLTLKLGSIGSVGERSFTWTLTKSSHVDVYGRVARRY